MTKQPYIPLYTGDYLKDTRRLPLEVRGAWVDIMIFMWESKEKGTITGTMEEFALMLGCSFKKANQIIAMLQEKEICDYEITKNGHIKLISRRIVRDVELSKARSKAGKAGAAAKFAGTFAEAKPQANSDIDIDNGISIQKEKEKNVSREPLYDEDNFYQTAEQAFNEIKDDDVMVENLLRIARREGYVTYNALTVVSAVRSFVTTEGAKPDFTSRPRDELKRHLVNWIRSKAKTLNQYAGT